MRKKLRGENDWKPAKAKLPKALSEGEETMARDLSAYNIGYLREYQFAPPRRWKFDFALLSNSIAIECEGGVYGRGRHTRPKGFIADCEKYTEAAIKGFKVLRFTTDQITSGVAIQTVLRALGRV
jgi:very-short-patch-repair endonuclease